VGVGWLLFEINAFVVPPVVALLLLYFLTVETL